MGGDLVDPVSHRPLVYHPGAPLGTRAILLAQPEPREVGLWPFARIERLGVRADGMLVRLQDDSREVRETKVPVTKDGGS